MLWVYRWHLDIEQPFFNTTKNTAGQPGHPGRAGCGTYPSQPARVSSSPRHAKISPPTKAMRARTRKGARRRRRRLLENCLIRVGGGRNRRMCVTAVASSDKSRRQETRSLATTILCNYSDVASVSAVLQKRLSGVKSSE